jgi:O-glycosyl hydrolase
MGKRPDCAVTSRRAPVAAHRSRERKRRLAAVVPWVTAVSLSVSQLPARARAQEHIGFDSRSEHSFSGFGVQVWPLSAHQAVRDQLLRGLRVRYLRLSVDIKVPEPRIRDHMSVQDVTAAIDETEATPAGKTRTDAYRALRREIDQLEVQLHLIVWQAPRNWTRFLRASGSKTFVTINPEYIADYANYIVAQVLYARRIGFHPIAVALTNEPNGGWNTLLSPEQYASLLAKVRAGMNSRGLRSIEIEGPETTGPGAELPYLAAIRRSNEGAFLSAVSIHLYERSPLPDAYQALQREMAAAAGGLPLFVTEYRNDSSRWAQTPMSPPALRGPREATDSPAFGVAVVRDTLRLVGAGANAVFY